MPLINNKIYSYDAKGFKTAVTTSPVVIDDKEYDYSV